MIDSARQQPDYSSGEEFLRTLRVTLKRRHRRRAVLGSLAASVGAVLLFTISLTALQQQADNALWESYLLGDVAQPVAVEVLDEASWELYLESLLLEDDLDRLLDGIVGLDAGEDWLQTIQLKG